MNQSWENNFCPSGVVAREPSIQDITFSAINIMHVHMYTSNFRTRFLISVITDFICILFILKLGHVSLKLRLYLFAVKRSELKSQRGKNHTLACNIYLLISFISPQISPSPTETKNSLHHSLSFYLYRNPLQKPWQARPRICKLL